jgi:phosphate transport system permease protein
MRNLNWREFVITQTIKFIGYSAILFVGLIFLFLLREGAPALIEVPFSTLLGIRWYPIEAIYIAEIAPRWAREILKPLVEVLGGLPSVMLGFLGILIITPIVRERFDLPTGLTAFTGALILGFMAIPTIVSVAEDALDAVPQTYRQAALALGATEWQTIWRVTLPAARSGILTAVLLGIGRTIGETMTVMMVTGNAPVLPTGLGALFRPARTMTATIAAEMGEVANGSVHYHVLFLIGIVLFLISLIINLAATSVVFRQKKRTERILS